LNPFPVPPVTILCHCGESSEGRFISSGQNQAFSARGTWQAAAAALPQPNAAPSGALML
jgi:hypothetical protein